MCCKSQRLPPSDCQVSGGTTRCCNYQLEIHARQWLQRQRQRNRKTGRRKKVGEEKGRGEKFTGIRGNSSEKYSLTCTVKRMFVVVTDNRVVSSNCRVYAYTIHALQTIDSSALVVAIRSSLPHSYVTAQRNSVTVTTLCFFVVYVPRVRLIMMKMPPAKCGVLLACESTLQYRTQLHTLLR